MADAPQIRVVISATAAELRAALKGAQGDLGSLSAQIKAVPDRIGIDVRAETTAAIARIKELQLQAGLVPTEINITASADTGVAQAKLSLLSGQIRDLERQAALAELGGLGGFGGGGGGRQTTIAAGGGGDGGRSLLWGRGIAGAAGVATVGSFAGFGFEHFLAVLGGLLGSATNAALGAGTLAAGSLGKMAVGGGSDLAVLRSTIADTKTLAQAWAQVGSAQQAALPFQKQFAQQARIVANPAVLSDYQKLVEAIRQHGINSTQAATADTNLSKAVKAVGNPQLSSAFSSWQSQLSGVASATAGLNAQMTQMGNTAGVKAELGLAKATSALNDFWNAQTSGARVQAVAVLMQWIKLATDFVPLVAQAAQQNLAIINQAIRPLFAWLEGPHGVGIFLNLEDQFRAQLPTAIHAFTQALELVLRYVSLASNYTGGFITWLDQLFTRLNSHSDFQISGTISRLVDDFRLWEHFVKLLILDVYTLFNQDLGTGNQIILTLTGMLQKFHDWETSTQGRSQIHTIFSVHLAEIKALLALVDPLASILSRVYMTIAPPLVAAVTAIAKAFAWVLQELVSLGPAMQVLVGFAALALKFSVIRSALAGIATALGLISARGPAAAAGVIEVQAAASGAGASAAVGGGSLISRLAPSAMAGSAAGALATRAGLADSPVLPMVIEGLTPVMMAAGAAVGGLFAGSFIQSATGLRGGAAGTVGGGVAGGIGGAIAGNLLDFIPGVGPVVGALFGATIGSALGPSLEHLLSGIFDSPDYGKRFADQFSAQFTHIVPPKVKASMHQAVDQAFNQVQSAKDPGASAGAFGVLFKPNAKQIAAAYANLGKVVGQQFVRGLQSTPFPSIAALVSDFNGELAKLPPQARAKAAEAMIAFTQQLQDSGRLPKGAVQAIISNIETAFPGLTNALRLAGDNAGASLQGIQSEVVRTLGTIRGNFGLLNIDPNVTGKNLLANITTAYGDMTRVIATSTGQAQREAVAALGALRHQSGQLLDAMLAKTESSMTLQAAAVARGTSGAARVAGLNMADFQRSILSAMHAGVISSTSGSNLITKAVNAELHAFGAKPIPIGVLAASEPASMPVFVGGGHSGTFAQGGLTQFGRPGEAGRDTIALNMGGQDIRVGPGEVGAVLTRHHVAELNHDYAHEGGLAGWFQKRKRPNYMASGGFAAGGYTGYSLPLPRGSMMPGSWSVDQGVDIPAGAGTPEFAIGPGRITAEGIGGFGPNAPVLQISSGPLAGRSVYYGHAGPDLVRVGQSVAAGQQISEVGSGIVGISTGPHIEIGFYPPGPMGSGSAMEILLNQLMGGAGVTGIAGAGLIPTIKAPRVRGSGTLADMARAFLGKETTAANAYLARQVPNVGSAGVAGSAGSASGPVEDQVYKFFSAAGFNKIAIAGMLGNAQQESSMDPNAPGGGLWQQITNFGQGTGGTLLNQMQTMLPQIAGIRFLLNAAASPGAAATLFMSLFEKPNLALANLPNRISSANAAYAAGYEGGGLLPGFAAGGLAPGPIRDPIDSKTGKPIPKGFLGHRHPHRRTVPGDRLKGGPGLGHRPGLRAIDKRMDWLERFLGQGSHDPHGISYLSEQLGYWPGIWALQNPTAWAIAGDPSQAVITTDPKTGNQIAPYLDAKDVEQAKDWLSKQIGWESRVVSDLKQAVPVSQAASALIRKAIEARRDLIAKKAKRVAENIRRMKELQRKIEANKKLITRFHGGPGQGLGRTQADTVRIEAWQAQNTHWTHQIGALSRENIALTGAGGGGGITPHGYGGQSVTGGQIGAISKTVAGLQSSQQAIASGYSPIIIHGVSGHGGMLGPAQTSLDQLTGALGAIDPAALRKALHLAQAASSASRQQALDQLLSSELALAQSDFLTSQSQFGVLQGFAGLAAGRLVGSFQSGIDFVPHTGLALVHRGEKIVPDPEGPAASQISSVHTAQGPIVIEVVLGNNEEPLMKVMRATINEQALPVISSQSGRRARLLAGTSR